VANAPVGREQQFEPKAAFDVVAGSVCRRSRPSWFTRLALLKRWPTLSRLDNAQSPSVY